MKDIHKRAHRKYETFQHSLWVSALLLWKEWRSAAEEILHWINGFCLSNIIDRILLYRAGDQVHHHCLHNSSLNFGLLREPFTLIRISCHHAIFPYHEHSNIFIHLFLHCRLGLPLFLLFSGCEQDLFSNFLYLPFPSHDLPIWIWLT